MGTHIVSASQDIDFNVGLKFDGGFIPTLPPPSSAKVRGYKNKPSTMSTIVSRKDLEYLNENRLLININSLNLSNPPELGEIGTIRRRMEEIIKDTDGMTMAEIIEKITTDSGMTMADLIDRDPEMTLLPNGLTDLKGLANATHMVNSQLGFRHDHGYYDQIIKGLGFEDDSGTFDKIIDRVSGIDEQISSKLQGDLDDNNINFAPFVPLYQDMEKKTINKKTILETENAKAYDRLRATLYVVRLLYLLGNRITRLKEAFNIDNEILFVAHSILADKLDGIDKKSDIIGRAKRDRYELATTVTSLLYEPSDSGLIRELRNAYRNESLNGLKKTLWKVMYEDDDLFRSLFKHASSSWKPGDSISPYIFDLIAARQENLIKHLPSDKSQTLGEENKKIRRQQLAEFIRRYPNSPVLTLIGLMMTALYPFYNDIKRTFEGLGPGVIRTLRQFVNYIDPKYVQDMQEEITKLKSNIEENKQQNNADQEEINRLRGKITELKGAKEQLREAKKQLEQEAQEWMDKATANEGERIKTVKDLTSEQKEAEKLRSEVTKLKTDNNNSQNTINELQKQIAANTEMKKTQAEELEKKVAEMQKQEMNNTEAINEATEKLTAKEAKVEILKRELEANKLAQDQLKNQKGEQKKRIQELEDSFRTTNEKLRAAEEKLTEADNSQKQHEQKESKLIADLKEKTRQLDEHRTIQQYYFENNEAVMTLVKRLPEFDENRKSVAFLAIPDVQSTIGKLLEELKKGCTGSLQECIEAMETNKLGDVLKSNDNYINALLSSKDLMKIETADDYRDYESKKESAMAAIASAAATTAWFSRKQFTRQNLVYAVYATGGLLTAAGSAVFGGGLNRPEGVLM